MLKIANLLALPGAAQDVDDHYKTAPSMSFSAPRGEPLWKGEVIAKDGSQRSCAKCHGTALSKSGMHSKAGEVIEPMVHSANNERFTDRGKGRKMIHPQLQVDHRAGLRRSREGRHSRLSVLTLVIANQRTGNNET